MCLRSGSASFKPRGEHLLSSTPITPGARLSQLAGEKPDAVALICEQIAGEPATLTWGELEIWANRLSHRLAALAVGQSDFVAINLPNGIEHVVATQAAYKLGACPMPVGHKMPNSERVGMLQLARPKAVISDAPELQGITRQEMRALDKYPSTPPPDAIPQPFKAVASGGSTGVPKLIVSPGAFHFPPDGHPFAELLGVSAEDRLYCPGPLYHNQAFFFTQVALFAGASVVLNEKFDADKTLENIARHRPSVLSVVPTMMLRMARSGLFQSADLASLKRLWHMAAPCAEWVKRAWIDRIGPAKVCEMWAATEITGITCIDGEEWSKRPGSVGRGFKTDIRIVDSRRQDMPVNEVGEIFTRFGGGTPQYRYLGANPLETLGDGFVSVGDLGYLDEEGYLFLADRRTDLIITGGSNVYPAEVESVITQFAGVRDAAVIGVKDDDLGRRVYALIEPVNPDCAPSQAELDAHVRMHLASYKVPKVYEIVPALPRDEAGKIRRSGLRDERGG